MSFSTKNNKTVNCKNFLIDPIFDPLIDLLNLIYFQLCNVFLSYLLTLQNLNHT